MKYVVYYKIEDYGKYLNNKAGKVFKENVTQVLGPNVIWIASTDPYTRIEALAE